MYLREGDLCERLLQYSGRLSCTETKFFVSRCIKNHGSFLIIFSLNRTYTFSQEVDEIRVLFYSFSKTPLLLAVTAVPMCFEVSLQKGISWVFRYSWSTREEMFKQETYKTHRYSMTNWCSPNSLGTFQMSVSWQLDQEIECLVTVTTSPWRSVPG